MNTNKWRNFRDLLGRKGFLSLSITILAAFFLGFCEVFFAASLEQFLASIQVLSTNSKSFSIGDFDFNSHSTIQIFGFLMVVLIFRTIFQLMSSYGSEYSRSYLIFRLREKLFNLIIWQKYEKRLRLDEIGNYLGEIFPKAGESVISISKSAVAFTQSLVILMGMLLNGFNLTMYVVAGSFLVISFVKIINKKILKLSRNIPILNQEVVNYANQNAQNRVFIQINGMQREQEQYSIAKALEYLKFNLLASFTRYLFVALYPLLGISVLLISILYLHTQGSLEQDTNVFTFIVLYIRFVQNSSGAFNFLSAFFTFLPQLMEALIFWQKKSEPYLAISTSSGKQNAEHVLPQITIQDLAFRWKDKNVFNGLNIDIHKGELFGVVGRSGSGKSTLMSLILGIVSPHKGNIKINGKEAKQWLVENSQSIGYVGVNPFIINGTIFENLTYGLNKEVSEEQIWKILEEASLASEIRSMKMGLATPLNEFGDGLSSGQKQRLAIARALLKNPSLLVLDEATANLDETTENIIFRLIENMKKKMTILMISHDSSLKEIYDNYLDLDRGQTL